MGSDINRMRIYIMQHPYYKKSQKWIDKVNAMSDSQVLAIYNKFKNLDYSKLEREMNK